MIVLLNVYVCEDRRLPEHVKHKEKLFEVRSYSYLLANSCFLVLFFAQVTQTLVVLVGSFCFLWRASPLLPAFVLG